MSSFNFDFNDYRSVDNRAILYKLKEDSDINLLSVEEYINDRYSSYVNCDSAKKKYLYVTVDDIDIEDILTNYLIENILDISNIIEPFMLIKSNIDVFFDITENEENGIIIESC